MNEDLTNENPVNESVADRHRRLAAAFHAAAEAVPAAALGRPTPCQDWAIADVIKHVTSTQLDFLGQRALPVPGDQTPAAVSAAMQAALDAPTIAGASYDSHFGPTTIAETVDAFYCLDLVMHRWDIAVAAGLSVHIDIDDADITRCRALLEPMGDNIRMPGIFGPEVKAPSSASETEQFVAWTGRNPAFAKA